MYNHHDGMFHIMMVSRSKMVRTQIQFTEDQLSALRSRASQEGVSVSELVRRAVDGYADDPSGPSPEDKRQRALDVAGRFSSGCADVASEHDRYLTESFGE